jgi:hypothetical protein
MAEIRARAEAATDGPWREAVLGSEGYDVRAPDVIRGASRIPRARPVARCGQLDWDADKANAQFIAHARQDVPWLLAEVERLTAERDRARDLAARLEAQIARVEALAEDWRYKDEFGRGAWQEGYGPDLEGAVLDDAAARLRAALTEFDDDECPRPDQPANLGKVEDGFGMVVSRCAERCRVEVVRPGKVQCSPSCLLDHPEAGGE